MRKIEESVGGASVSRLDSLYPGQKGGHSGIDARVVSLAAADAPRHEPHLPPHAVLELHQRPATVTLRC